jgi:predicted SAM-dependent methyltransferase
MRALLKKLILFTGYTVTRVPSSGLSKYETGKRTTIPRYLNIGAGKWSHPMWHNLDNPREDYSKSKYADLAFDLTSGKSWPVDNNSLDLIYSSHTIEHLNDRFFIDLCGESFRCLKPGGLIRLVTPDMDLYARAYERRDRSFFDFATGTHNHSLEQSFLHSFAGLFSDFHEGNELPKVSDEEISHAYRTSETQADFFDRFCKAIPDELVRAYPKHHKTWFTAEKLCSLMSSYFEVRRSAYGQSWSPILRNTSFFDCTHPQLSLYIEASKPLGNQKI